MKYAVTFQQKYNAEDRVHSVRPEIDGHSYYVINYATDEDDAREQAFAIFGQDWAFVYPLDAKFLDDIAFFGLTEVKL